MTEMKIYTKAEFEKLAKEHLFIVEGYNLDKEGNKEMKIYGFEALFDQLTMTSNDAKQKADLIWSKLFSKDGKNRTKQDELNLIESVVIQIAQEQKKVGRGQILSHFAEEIKNLRD